MGYAHILGAGHAIKTLNTTFLTQQYLTGTYYEDMAGIHQEMNCKADYSQTPPVTGKKWHW